MPKIGVQKTIFSYKKYPLNKDAFCLQINRMIAVNQEGQTD